MKIYKYTFLKFKVRVKITAINMKTRINYEKISQKYGQKINLKKCTFSYLHCGKQVILDKKWENINFTVCG